MNLINNMRNNNLLRKISIVLTFLMLGCLNLRADILTDARSRFSKGDYEQSAKLFEQSLKKGKPRAMVYYELARAFSKAGNNIDAVLNYRRALILDPGFTPAIVGLRESNVALGVPEERGDWRTTFSRWMPMDTVALIGAVFFWIGAFWLLLVFFHIVRWRIPAILLVLMGIAAVTLVWFCDPRILFHDEAMVLTQGGTSVLTAPAEQSEKIGNIPAGGIVRVLSRRGRWIYGELPHGTKGWFPSQGIAPLIPSS